MYTGIVTATFEVSQLIRNEASTSLWFRFDAPHLEGLFVGASVSANGTCLTVSEIADDQVRFDLSDETLRLTNLGDLELGSVANIERSAKIGAENGGHVMSGHVDGLAEVIDINRTSENCTLRIRLPDGFAKYVFNKGFIGLNGCSLTVGDLDKSAGTFSLYLIPETLRQTTYDGIQVGDRLNLEIDRQTQIIVDTVFAAVEAAIAKGD